MPPSVHAMCNCVPVQDGAAASARDIGSGLLGVLGGMGPLATVDFMKKLVAATPAVADQDHIPVIVSSLPQIPDRAAAFRGDGVSPLDGLIDSALRLQKAGTELIVIPCNTAHLWFEELQSHIRLPMLHIVDTAIEAAVARSGARATVGLLATDATVASGLFVNRPVPDRVRHVSWMQPTAQEMVDWVMPGIASVKSGQLDIASALLLKAAEALARRGASAIVLGCTEIPIVLSDVASPVPVVDATDALAREAVRWSLSRRAAAAGRSQ